MEMASQYCFIISDSCGTISDDCGMISDSCGMTFYTCGMISSGCGLISVGCGRVYFFGEWKFWLGGFKKNSKGTILKCKYFFNFFYIILQVQRGSKL